MGMNNSLQAIPVDLASVREAAQEVGVTVATMQGWLKRSGLPVHASPHGKRVSLAAVHALRARLAPQAPGEAGRVSEVARAVGVATWSITRWARQVLLPAWQSHHGLLVRPTDVRVLAQKRGVLPPDAEAGE